MALPLSQDRNITEFIEILQNNKINSQYRDFTEMLGYVSEIESKLKSALGEVTKLEKRVNDMESRQFKNICMKMVNSIKSAIREAQAKLNEIKAAIIEGAKQAAAAFKENGIAALNSVMKFFKIKDGLDALKDSVDKSIVSASKSINKIEQISGEIHASGSHRRNIVRIIMGREKKDDVKSNGKVMKAIQLPFKGTRAAMSGVKKAVVSMTAKLESLDKTARANKEKKQSLLAEVKNFKPPEKTADVDKSKKRETALE